MKYHGFVVDTLTKVLIAIIVAARWGARSVWAQYIVLSWWDFIVKPLLSSLREFAKNIADALSEEGATPKE